MDRKPEPKKNELVVFDLISNTKCEECGEELLRGSHSCPKHGFEKGLDFEK